MITSGVSQGWSGRNNVTQRSPSNESPSRHIAFVGDYLPRHCDFANFTHDLCEAVAARYSDTDCFVGAVNDRPDGLHHDRTNENQGAESSLAFYLAHAEMTLAQNLMEAQTPNVT